MRRAAVRGDSGSLERESGLVVCEQANALSGFSDNADLHPSGCRKNKGVEIPGQRVIECTDFAVVIRGSLCPERLRVSSDHWTQSVWVGPPARGHVGAPANPSART